jgi:hypothetical protein
VQTAPAFSALFLTLFFVKIYNYFALFKYFFSNVILYRIDVKLIKKSVEELESKVTEILFSYTNEQIKSLVSYNYILKAMNI